MGDTYTHGHHGAVVAQHARRTAENCAAYLLPHIRSGDHLLDIGCGPGSITVGLAEAVGDGTVIGLDVVEPVLDGARGLASERGLTNVTFDTGDIYDLDAEDNHFDVTHAHQVLQHLTRPTVALSEMARVTKPGGLIAVRDVEILDATTPVVIDGVMDVVPVTGGF